MSKKWIAAALVLGSFQLLTSGWRAANAGIALIRSGTPVPAEVANAPAEQWVRLEDAVLHCETRSVTPERKFTYFLADAAGGGHPFLAQLAGDVPCDAKGLEGAFVPGRFTISADFHVALHELGLPRLFTQAFSREFILKELIFESTYALAGMFVVVLGVAGALRLRRTGKPARK